MFFYSQSTLVLLSRGGMKVQVGSWTLPMFVILLFTLVDGQGGGGVGVTILVIFCERHKCISYTVCDPLVSQCVFINVKLSKAGHFIR